MKRSDSHTVLSISLFFLVPFFLVPIFVYSQESYQHRMKEGETLYSISKQYNVPVEILLEANSILDPSKIRAGTTIRIPDIYTVQKGDTLYGIARKSGTTLETILSMNSLKPDSILKPGTTLYIPKTSGGEPAKDLPRVTQNPSVPKDFYWPHSGTRKELTGKLEGISFAGKAGDPVYSVSSGKVAWVGPYRGFGKVVIIQSDQGYIYVYAGNESILVEPGSLVKKGQKIGTLGINPYNQTPDLYFLVYKDGKPVRPEEAPRI